MEVKFIVAMFLMGMALLGCAHRPSAGYTYTIGQECAPLATLTGCDRASPPKCQHVAIQYKQGCERVIAK